MMCMISMDNGHKARPGLMPVVHAALVEVEQHADIFYNIMTKPKKWGTARPQ